MNLFRFHIRNLKWWQMLLIGIAIIIIGKIFLNKIILNVSAQELQGRNIVSYDNTDVIDCTTNGVMFTRTNKYSSCQNYSYLFYTHDADNTLNSYGATDFGSNWTNAPTIKHMNMLYSAPHHLELTTSQYTYLTNNLYPDKTYTIIYYFSTSKNVKVSNTGWFDTNNIQFGLNTHNGWNNYQDFMEYSAKWYNPYSSIGHGGELANPYDNNVGILVIQFKLRSSINLTATSTYDLENIIFNNEYEWEEIEENTYKAKNSSIIFSTNENVDLNNTTVIITGIDFLEDKDIYISNELVPPVSGDSTGANSTYLVNRDSMNLIYGVDVPLLELDSCNGPTDFSCHFGNVITMLKNTFILLRNLPQIVSNMIEFYVNVFIDNLITLKDNVMNSLSNFINTIRSFIDSIWNNFTSNLSNVFTPSYTNIENKMEELHDLFDEKIPELTTFIGYIGDIIDRISNLQPQRTISFNGVKFPGTNNYIIPAFTYDFNTLIQDQQINPWWRIVRTVNTWLLLMLLCIFIYKFGNSILHNSKEI